MKINEIKIRNLKNGLFFFKLLFICLIMILLIKNNKILKLKIIKKSLKKNDNFLNDNLIYKIKKVVYSALLGNYDSIKQFNKQGEFDFFLFTDLNIKTKTNWTILRLPDDIMDLNLNIKKRQRFINFFYNTIFNRFHKIRRLNYTLIYFLRIMIYLYILIQVS